MARRRLTPIFPATPYTLAQRLLMHLGVDPFRLEAHRSDTRDRFNRSYSCTKRGPGRVHQQGRRKTEDDHA